MRKFLLGFFCFFFAFLSLDAQTLRGKVVDEKGTPVSYANVAILRSNDSSFLSGVFTNKEGEFTIKTPAPGTYSLRISSIGFKEIRTESFEIAGPDFTKDFGTVGLKIDSKALKSVDVSTLRPTIIQKADRMVVSVEGTAMAQGNNAFNVLSKAPGVFIDNDGNIQLNGKGGVTVMIDNKLTYLSARDLRNFLEGMSAENIKNIEIITNPSSKYDAEGTSGILNINLKKNTQQGINGSVYASYNYNFKQQHGYTYGGNLNFKSGNWNSFLNLDAARRVGGRDATFTRIFYTPSKTTYFDQVATGEFTATAPPSVRLGTDYSFNKMHSIGFMGYYSYGKIKDNFLTDTYIGSAPKTYTQFIDADNFNSGAYKNFTSNLHYVGQLDTLGKQLSVDLDYVKIKNTRQSDMNNYFTDLTTDTKTKDILYTYSPSGYDIYSVKSDFTQPINKTDKVEAGLKFSNVVSDTDSRFYFNNGSLVLDPNRTNHFKYSENIYAAYLNWTGNLHKKLTLQLGLRAEETVSRGRSFTTGTVADRDYLNLFPSVFVQQKVNDNYGINYSYSRRLTRPNYGNLNPFRAYRDPYTWYEGNPYLRPQYTHSFGITQVFKKIYNLSISYQRTTDVMAEIPILDVNNAVTVYTTGNVNTGDNVGLSAVGPLKISKWWDTQNTILFSYSKFSMNSNLGLVENDQLFAMLQTNHTILLPRQIRMELNILLRGPAASGLYHMGSMHRVDIAFKRSFLNKKFDLTLNATDIFKGFRYYWTTNINGNKNDFDQYFRIRTVGVSLRYNFHKGQKVDLKSRSSIEELNRTGG